MKSRILKEIIDEVKNDSIQKKYENSISRLSKRYWSEWQNVCFAEMQRLRAEGKPTDTPELMKNVKLSDEAEAEKILTYFEVGLISKPPFPKDKIDKIKRDWILEILENFHNSKTEAERRLKYLSTNTIDVFRAKVFEKKYWNHAPFVYYQYTEYFVYLLDNFIQGKKPNSTVAQEVDFRLMFGKDFEAIKKAFTKLN